MLKKSITITINTQIKNKQWKMLAYSFFISAILYEMKSYYSMLYTHQENGKNQERYLLVSVILCCSIIISHTTFSILYLPLVPVLQLYFHSLTWFLHSRIFRLTDALHIDVITIINILFQKYYMRWKAIYSVLYSPEISCKGSLSWDKVSSLSPDYFMYVQ